MQTNCPQPEALPSNVIVSNAYAIVLQDSPLVTAAPVLTLTWLAPGDPQPHPHALAVPLYTSMERQKLVAELQLPLAAAGSEAQLQHWVLAGAALMLPL